MSALPQISSIHKINFDVLLYIIALNGNMFFDPTALRTTRTASQVCQNWRNLMLDTPSLWAKLIDLNGISSRNYEWLNELLRRSRSAPLWIRGDHIQIEQPVGEHSEHNPQSFFDFTRENWHRIEKLIVNLHVPPDFYPTDWTTLHCPAPELDTFDVSFEWAEFIQRPHVPITTLFAGHAPKLRRFSLGTYIVDEHSPWLRHLHTMQFHCNYSIDLALSVLSSTGQLKQLILQDIYDASTDTSLPIVSLTDLEYLEYDGPPQLGATLLDHVKIPMSCSLSIPAAHIPNDDELEHIRVIGIYTKYIGRFLQACTPKVICIDLDKFHYISLKAGDAFSNKLPLDISIPLYNMHTYTMVLNRVAIQELSSAVELRISTSVSLDMGVMPFFNCLTSLETIYADAKSLFYLGNLQNPLLVKQKKFALFPNLKVVNLVEDQYRAHIFDRYPVGPAISSFFVQRAQDGNPITTLRLMEPLSTSVIPDFEDLNEAPGLKVLYKRFGATGELEHVCGGHSST